jgi:hypothetical protein
MFALFILWFSLCLLVSVFPGFFCSLVSFLVPVFDRPYSLVFPPSVRGLSLAFIKPENAMRLPPDNEAILQDCYCRSNGNDRLVEALVDLLQFLLPVELV